MGCENCSNSTSGIPSGCKNNGSCGTGGCNKLSVFDWLSNMELPGNAKPFEIMEIRFKNGRKEFYRNSENLALHNGDIVAVDANPGHDIGIVSLTGELVRLQLLKKKSSQNPRDYKRIFRKAHKEDVDVWLEARSLEQETMYRTRTLASSLGLQMKISDVEYQGDKTKAVFYYTADGRVDFRELIKKMAEEFRIRVEMRQIGARQEAGRVGGIGSCGRELCCSTWLTDFRSVSTGAARYQQLSLNPQKLAGQCGKLKCCLNYELDSYMDALKQFPKNSAKLNTRRGIASHMKTDIFKGILWYIYGDEPASSPIALSVSRVKEILKMNDANKLPDDLIDFEEVVETSVAPDYMNVVGQDSLTRFDKKKSKKRKNNKRKKQPVEAVNAAPKNSPEKGNRPPRKKRRPSNRNNNSKGKNNNPE